MRSAPAMLLLLAACGPTPDAPQDLASLDRELADANSAGNARDPAIAEALHAPIMVDPTLAQQSNANAVRPAPRPDPGAAPLDMPRPDPVDAATLKRAPTPKQSCPQCAARADAFTLGALAARQSRAAGCANVGYSATWANRLPATLPLYPDARVIEAAGKTGATCALTAVSFASSVATDKLIDWYFTHAMRAGHSAEHRSDGAMHVLAGGSGAAVYIVYVSPRPGGGSDVDLVSSAGPDAPG